MSDKNPHEEEIQKDEERREAEKQRLLKEEADRLK